MKHPDGLHMMYSRVNQAWLVMWNDQVLRIFNRKWEAKDYIAGLQRKENPLDTTSALAGIGILTAVVLFLSTLKR